MLDKYKSDRYREVHREANRRWKRENREAFLAQKARYRAKNQDKVMAVSQVNNAIRKGLLTRGACEVCGATSIEGAPIEGHHEDYARPLDVRWLCRKHHQAHHNKMSGGE